MKYIEKQSRDQMTLLPDCIEDYIGQENPVRVIDAFVDSLDLWERKERYEGYLQELDETGETQLLTTDPQARRMRSKDGFHCCYNVQTAVDGGSHLIAEYEVTSRNTDQGLLCQMAAQSKETLGVAVIETVADKGYESREDILDCVMNGIIPNVALKYDKTERLFQIDYREAEITGELRQSTKPEDIRTCIAAGILPACYENSSITVEVQRKTALSCFIRNEDDTVTCPTGKTLNWLENKGVNAIYANKDACRQCQNRCKSGYSHKRVSFGPHTKVIPTWVYGAVKQPLTEIPADIPVNPNNHVLDRTDYAKPKKVVLCIRPDKEKLHQRMCLSEHPFGTVKWWNGAHYLLCRGTQKASAELGLSFLAYNLKRAINLVGTQRLIAAMRG